MYVIAVKVPVTYYHTEIGFYSNLYKTHTNEGMTTFINYIKTDDEWCKIKQFKTYKAAENKLKFLQNKINENGYMWGWELSIEEITEEDLIKSDNNKNR